MRYAWIFMKEQGSMTAEDYPYTGIAGDCMHDSKKVVGKLAYWGQVGSSIEDAKRKLQEQPLTVALDARSPAFRFYKSGVIDESDDCG